MACPGHAVLGRVIPKTLRTTNLQSITTKCKQRLSLGRSLGRPCPRRHALGMLSLAGSVPAPCERRTYTRKQNPNIFMQWGWELSQQWSSGEFREIKVCNQKGQKGSTGRLGIWTLFWTFFEVDKCCVPVANLAASEEKVLTLWQNTHCIWFCSDNFNCWVSPGIGLFHQQFFKTIFGL